MFFQHIELNKSFRQATINSSDCRTRKQQVDLLTKEGRSGGFELVLAGSDWLVVGPLLLHKEFLKKWRQETAQPLALLSHLEKLLYRKTPKYPLQEEVLNWIKLKTVS